MYWNEYKTKSEIKISTDEYRYFLESNFVWVHRLLVLVYSNQDGNAKMYKARRYYLPKGVIKNYNVIIHEKKLFDQPIDTNINWCKEIKLTTGKGENYTTGCLLDYDYIKIYYRLIVVNSSRQKELDADLKAIQKIESVGQ